MFSLSTPENLGDLFRDPQRLKDAFAVLRILVEAQVEIVSSSAVVSGPKSAFILSPSRPLLILPIGIGMPIADSTATAASVSTQLNLLLAGLRRTKQLPS